MGSVPVTNRRSPRATPVAIVVIFAAFIIGLIVGGILL